MSAADSEGAGPRAPRHHMTAQGIDRSALSLGIRDNMWHYDIQFHIALLCASLGKILARFALKINFTPI